LHDGRWIERSFAAALQKAGFGLTPNYENPRDLGAAAFDDDDALYILIPTPNVRNKSKPDEIEINGDAVLLYSKDYGETFAAYLSAKDPAVSLHAGRRRWRRTPPPAPRADSRQGDQVRKQRDRECLRPTRETALLFI
jgi:hypothetical protein